MKATLLTTCALSTLLVLSSCKGKQVKQDEGSATTQSTTSGTDQKQPANAPATYEVKYSPDSAVLGKEKEALVKFLGGEVVALQDQEGKATGMAVTLKLRVTNKSTLEHKKYFSVQPTDARLELDNGTSVPLSYGEGNSNPEPEATTEASWKVEIPAGTKPTKLNLFLDGTRVSVAVALEDKK